MSNSELSRFEEINRELIEGVSAHPDWWEWRKALAVELYNDSQFDAAADLIWSAPEIPPVDTELAFSVRILAKAKGRRAIRLTGELINCTRDNPAKLKQLSVAFLEQGMVMESVRFYGAATLLDSSLTDPEFEYWILWVDEYQRLWGEWKEAPKYEELPWLKPQAVQQFKELFLPIRPQMLGGVSVLSEDRPAAEGGLPPMPPIKESPMATRREEEVEELQKQKEEAEQSEPELPSDLVAVGGQNISFATAPVPVLVPATSAVPIPDSAPQPHKLERVQVPDGAMANAIREITDSVEIPKSSDPTPVAISRSMIEPDPNLMASSITKRQTIATGNGTMVPTSPLASTSQVPILTSMPAAAAGVVTPRRLVIPVADTTVKPESIEGADGSTGAMVRTRRIMMPQDLPKKTKPVYLAELDKALHHNHEAKAPEQRPQPKVPKPMRMMQPPPPNEDKK